MYDPNPRKFLETSLIYFISPGKIFVKQDNSPTKQWALWTFFQIPDSCRNALLSNAFVMGLLLLVEL